MGQAIDACPTVHSNENENGSRNGGPGARDSPLAGGDGGGQGNRCGIRGDLFFDQLLHCRMAAAAHAAGARSARDLAQRARAVADRLADGPVADAMAMTDDHGEIIPILKMKFKII